VRMKSCITLYGPRIAEGISVLELMVKDFKEDASYSRICTRMDPTIDLMTKSMIADGEEVLGEYDFCIEWRGTPSRKNLNDLINKLDFVLAPSGCRYTITTKK